MNRLQVLNPGVRRLAKAEMKRNRGRTALVFVLVTAAATLGLVTALLAEGDTDHAMGIVGNDTALVDQLLERAKPESFELWHWKSVRGLQVIDRPVLPSGDPDLLDDLLTGPSQHYFLVEGVAAAEPGEVVVSDETAQWLDLVVGDPLVLDQQELSVVGIAQGVGYSERVALLAPGSMTDGEIHGNAWFASQERVAELSNPGAMAGARIEGVPRAQLYEQFTGGDEAPAVSVLFTIMSMMMAGTVSAAAWTTGFRRRLSQMALAKVVGAEPRQLRLGVALQALWISMASVLASWLLVAIGQIGAVLLVDFRWPRFTGWTVAAIALNAAIVVVVSVFVAWLPMAQLRTGNVSAGLASRVENGAPSIRSVAGGLGLLTIGLALLRATVGGQGLPMIGLGLLGAITIAAGATLTMPWLIDLIASLATSRSAAGRLAIRGLAAQRHRSVGLVLVVGAIIVLATAGLTDNAGGQQGALHIYPGQAHGDEVAVLFGHPDPAQNAKNIEALEALGPRRVMQYSEPGQAGEGDHDPYGEMVFDADKTDQILALDMAGIEIENRWSSGRTDESPLMLKLTFGFLAVVLSLLGFLQRSEDSERRSALYGLGSPPSLYRRMAGWGGLLTGGIAAVVGTPLGLMVHLAVESETPRLVVPWVDLVILLVGVPLLASTIAVLTTPGPRYSRGQWQQDHVALAA